MSNPEFSYYLALEDHNPIGPYSRDELLERIGPDTLVWRTGIDWQLARDVPELSSYFQAPEPSSSPSGKRRRRNAPGSWPIGAAIVTALALLGGIAAFVHTGSRSDVSAGDAVPSQEPEFTFGEICHGNAWESCFIILEGRLVEGISDSISNGLRQTYAGTLYISSFDGSPLEAIRLGRLVREIGFTTAVGSIGGRPVEEIRGTDLWPTGGFCEGACALLFFGGLERRATAGTLALAGVLAAADDPDGGANADLVAELALYLSDMGIQGDILRRILEIPLGEKRFLSDHELIRYGLITPRGFGPFSITATEDGLRAISERQSPVRPYDHASKLQLFCSTESIMASIHGGDPSVEVSDILSATMGLDEDRIDVDLDSILIAEEEGRTSFTFPVPAIVSRSIAEASQLALTIVFPRVLGGNLSMQVDLLDEDRNVLRALLAPCTDNGGYSLVDTPNGLMLSEGAPLSGQTSSSGRIPTATPFTDAPQLTNRSEVEQALAREYPRHIRDAGIGSTVVVNFFINEMGETEEVQIGQSSGIDELDELALRIARLFEFTPARNEGVPVPVWIQLPIDLRAR